MRPTSFCETHEVRTERTDQHRFQYFMFIPAAQNARKILMCFESFIVILLVELCDCLQAPTEAT